MAHKGHLAKPKQWEQRNQDIIKEIVIIKCEKEVTWEAVANKSKRKMLCDSAQLSLYPALMKY